MALDAFIHRPTLAALKFAASTEETRYYLCGVYIDVSAGHVDYIATNGHIMAGRRVMNPYNVLNTLRGQAIVPLASCKGIKVPKGKTQHLSDPLHYGRLYGDALRPDTTITLSDHPTDCKSGVAFQPIDGTYPDWRRVVPACSPVVNDAQPLGASHTFDWTYLAAFQAFAGQLALGAVQFKPTCDGRPELLRFSADADAFGVVIPKRIHVKCPETLKRPSWI